MKTQHTPGPWTLEESKDGGDSILTESKNAKIALVYSGGEFHSDNGDWIVNEVKRANSKLITAAPDLLNALRKADNNMYELINYYKNESESFDDGSDERRMYLDHLKDAKNDHRIIKDAIKKATE